MANPLELSAVVHHFDLVPFHITRFVAGFGFQNGVLLFLAGTVRK